MRRDRIWLTEKRTSPFIVRVVLQPHFACFYTFPASWGLEKGWKGWHFSWNLLEPLAITTMLWETGASPSVGDSDRPLRILCRESTEVKNRHQMHPEPSLAYLLTSLNKPGCIILVLLVFFNHWAEHQIEQDRHQSHCNLPLLVLFEFDWESIVVFSYNSGSHWGAARVWTGHFGVYSMLLLFLCVLEKKCGNACDKSSLNYCTLCVEEWEIQHSNSPLFF